MIISYFTVLKIEEKQFLRFLKDFSNKVKRLYHLLNLSKIRSSADHSPDITNITAPTGTITRIRNKIISHPISRPERLHLLGSLSIFLSLPDSSSYSFAYL